MKRRSINKSLLLLPLASGIAAGIASSLLPRVATAYPQQPQARQTMSAKRTVLRGEPKNSATAPAGSFARTDSDGMLFLINGFGFQHQIPPDSYIEWHLDKTNTQLKFKCINSDQYRVKAFPCAVLGTMGGRFETLGNPGKVKGLENEFRMKGEGLQSPIFDMNPTRNLCGFPCFLADLPQTNVSAVTSYEGNPTVNTFLDMYLHDVDTPKTVSHPSLLGAINGINSNRTKAYNINVWFKKPINANGGSTRPDRGWAGGKVIGTANVAGHDFHVILKIETGGGNYFRYIALVPFADEIHSLNVNQVMAWAQSDLRGILTANAEAGQMMAKPDPRGFKAPRWPDERMVLSGLHLGNEIWWSDPAGQEGVVNWETMRVSVKGFGDFGWGNAKPSIRKESGNESAANKLPKSPGTQSSGPVIDVIIPENELSEPGKKKGFLERLFGRD